MPSNKYYIIIMFTSFGTGRCTQEAGPVWGAYVPVAKGNL